MNVYKIPDAKHKTFLIVCTETRFVYTLWVVYVIVESYRMKMHLLFKRKLKTTLT